MVDVISLCEHCSVWRHAQTLHACCHRARRSKKFNFVKKFDFVDYISLFLFYLDFVIFFATASFVADGKSVLCVSLICFVAMEKNSRKRTTPWFVWFCSAGNTLVTMTSAWTFNKVAMFSSFAYFCSPFFSQVYNECIICVVSHFRHHVRARLYVRISVRFDYISFWCLPRYRLLLSPNRVQCKYFKSTYQGQN